MATPTSGHETVTITITLPDAITKPFEINRRRTVDEVKQIILTRNYKIRGLRSDYYLVVNDRDVLFPEYRKFLESHPMFEGDASGALVRLVPKADVIDAGDGKKVYHPRPENKAQYLALTESAATRRKSVVLDEELERARLDAEAESRRRKRMSKELKEEEATRAKLEAEEQKKRELLNAKVEDDRRRRQAEREKQEEQRKKKEAEEDAVWAKLQQDRKKTREEERRRLTREHSVNIDRSKLREILIAGPTAVHAESHAVADSSVLTNSMPLSARNAHSPNPSLQGRDRASTGRSDQVDALEEQLAKSEREAKKRLDEIGSLRATNSKLETELETTKSLVAALQLRLERTERDVERQRVLAENRANAADREIASLKSICSRYKAVRDCVVGELQRVNAAQAESVNMLETRVVLDRVRDRLDSAHSGHHWRSTRSDFTSMLFSVDDLKEQILKWPPKNPAAVLAAVAEAGLEHPRAVKPLDIGPPSIVVSTDAPANIEASTSYETPRTPKIAEPEVEKICNLPPEQEIDYWQVLPTFGDLLGEGGYAEVFKAEYRGKPAAVKKFKIDYQAMEDGNPPMDVDLIRKEILVLSKLNHPNVMKFYGAAVIMPNICIVTELLVKGSLDTLIHDTPSFDMPLPWRVQRSIEVAQGLAYLHSVNPVVIHRDIKSGNVLLDENFTAKLSDFGLAKLKRNPFEMPAPKNSGIPPKWNVVLNSSPVGTAAWCAPEILEHAPYNESADIYSYGVFLWEFFTRESPWTGHSPKSIIDRTLSGARLEIPSSVPVPISDLMKATWSYDPWLRPTASDIHARLLAFKSTIA